MFSMLDYEHQEAALLFDGARMVKESKRRLETAWDITKIIEDFKATLGISYLDVNSKKQ